MSLESKLELEVEIEMLFRLYLKVEEKALGKIVMILYYLLTKQEQENFRLTTFPTCENKQQAGLT